MIIYLVGIGCVGKTTIGSMLAKTIGFTFFDLDKEIENFYQTSIERIQDACLGMHEFRRKGSIVLDQLFSKNIDSVISGTPSGLKFSYLGVYKKHKKDKTLYSIHLHDSFENVLNRLTFYDKDSNPIIEQIDELKRKRYLNAIKADYNYFASSYERADFQMNIEHIKLEDIPY
ncbi:MAG: shikimate kinase, partial [Sphaerochaetaceae bacterium]|nr:shikimate kinase [Sphaerochaetaceae bacterium]HHU87899.1 hypothetical protein [Spirochaetales bacterium]